MLEISNLRFMLDNCGVPSNKTEKLVNILQQALSHGINGTEFPPFTGFNPEDLLLGTKIAEAISKQMKKRGTMKRESELRVADIVVPADQTGCWLERMVVRHDKEKRTIGFARPHGSLNCAGTTCTSLAVTVENFDAPYNSKIEWQTQYIVVGRDKTSLMEVAHSAIRCIPRKRLEAYTDVLRNTLSIDAIGGYADMDWVNLQEHAMNLANILINKEMDVPYPV
jgi:hypothetical protein